MAASNPPGQNANYSIPTERGEIALFILREMRAAGSWDTATLDRAIELISALPADPVSGQAAGGVDALDKDIQSLELVRCPTCDRTDKEYRGGARSCSDPWHGDDHLRVKTPPSPPAPLQAGGTVGQWEATVQLWHLRRTVRDAIDALERNSTSAPVVECLKAALASSPPLRWARAGTSVDEEHPDCTTERARCIAICEGWIGNFQDKEIQYTTPREYAVDAIEDIIDLIRNGSVVPSTQSEGGK